MEASTARGGTSDFCRDQYLVVFEIARLISACFVFFFFVFCLSSLLFWAVCLALCSLLGEGSGLWTHMIGFCTSQPSALRFKPRIKQCGLTKLSTGGYRRNWVPRPFFWLNLLGCPKLLGAGLKGFQRTGGTSTQRFRSAKPHEMVTHR